MVLELLEAIRLKLDPSFREEQEKEEAKKDLTKYTKGGKKIKKSKFRGRIDDNGGK